MSSASETRANDASLGGGRYVSPMCKPMRSPPARAWASIRGASSAKTLCGIASALCDSEGGAPTRQWYREPGAEEFERERRRERRLFSGIFFSALLFAVLGRGANRGPGGCLC